MKEKLKIIKQYRFVTILFWFIFFVFSLFFLASKINTYIFGAIAFLFAILYGVYRNILKERISKTEGIVTIARPSEETWDFIRYLRTLYTPTIGTYYWTFLSLIYAFSKGDNDGSPLTSIITFLPLLIGTLASLLSEEAEESLFYEK